MTIFISIIHFAKIVVLSMPLVDPFKIGKSTISQVRYAPFGQYESLGEYCGSNNTSSVFFNILIITKKG